MICTYTIICSVFLGRVTDTLKIILHDINIYHFPIIIIGMQLETKMGSVSFLLLLIYSLLGSHSIFVLISYVLAVSDFSSDVSGINTCAVGFSAVIFSLKYILNQTQSEIDSSSSSSVYGMRVPLKYACWVELVVISLVTPNASFLGHLSGIVAGILYLHGGHYVRVVYKSLFVSAGRSRFASSSPASDRQTSARVLTLDDEDDYDFYYEVNDDEDEKYDYIPLHEVKSTSSLPGHADTVPPSLSREQLRQQRLQRFEKKNGYSNRSRQQRR